MMSTTGCAALAANQSALTTLTASTAPMPAAELPISQTKKKPPKGGFFIN